MKVTMKMNIIIIFERIVTKKFNNRTNQYEFLVKWKDYSDTWELF